jgi:2'-5' RNA ligase
MSLFLALWPSEPARDALAAVARGLAQAASGKAVPAEKIHLTLAFLGEVAPDRDEAVRAVAGGIRAAPFQLVLDSVGSFPKARVAWAGTSRPPGALARLQSELEAGLRAAGFALDERPFAAHVTLARKIARPVAAAPMAPIHWEAGEYVLARSETGTGRYSILETWSLDRD